MSVTPCAGWRVRRIHTAHLPDNHPTQLLDPVPHAILDLSPPRPLHTVVRPHLLFLGIAGPWDGHRAGSEGLNAVPACEGHMARGVVILNPTETG